MAKKNGNLAAKQKTQQKPKTVVPPTEETIVETVAAEAVNPTKMTAKNMAGTTHSSLDANHRVDLLSLAHKMFKEDPDAPRKYTVDFLDSMDKIMAAGIVSALADEAAYGEGSFSVILNHTMYPQLVIAAKEMGITLPNVKNLPVNEEGKVEVSKEQIRMSKEAKEELKKEKEIIDEKPELDPVKVANMDDEALNKALSYLLIQGPKTSKIKDTLVSVVDFMRSYSMAIADKADNAAEAKLKYDDYTTGQWLEMAFSHVKPTFLLHGIGRGLVSTICLEKSPITAFCIMRKSMTKDDGTVEWDDQSIADATKSIAIFVAKDCIAKEKANMEALDPKAKDYKDIKAKYEAAIQHYESCIEWITSNDSGIVENLITGLENDDPVLSKIYQRIRDRYYPNKSREVFKNLDTNVQQRAGIILNMFKEEGTRNLNYSETNISELVQYTKEELEEKRKAAVEAAQEEKKEEAKNA